MHNRAPLDVEGYSLGNEYDDDCHNPDSVHALDDSVWLLTPGFKLLCPCSSARSNSNNREQEGGPTEYLVNLS